MGIYLPNMEMPKDYSVIVKIFPDGRVGTIPYVQWFKVDLIPGTQAVPVPPHGRCIDADALTETTDGIWDCNDLYFQPNDKICDPNDCKGCKWRETMDCFRRMVKHAPTIIPAEESE